LAKQFKFLLLALFSCVPVWSFASLPMDAQVGEQRLPNWRWPHILNKLINNQMPQSYYDFLNSRGIYSVEQILRMDDETKQSVLKMYKDDLIIMAGGNQTRSIW
jgi:hypothetical protein